MRFDWDAANIEHIARHGVTPLEAEEAVLSDHLEYEPNQRTEEAEPRFGLVGTTKSGRVRVVTAYPASTRMIAKLEKHREKTE